MPLPAWLGRFNRRVTNPLLRPAASRLPLFGVVVHRGRHSGRTYRTPVNVFPSGDHFVIALTYGPEVEWVQNVLAAGRCLLIHRGHSVDLVRPRLLERPEDDAAVPDPVRAVLRLLDVTDFLRLDRDGAVPSG
jgi:deazaflavin-dependent oxidoreductase (nitroreductase family)